MCLLIDYNIVISYIIYIYINNMTTLFENYEVL